MKIILFITLIAGAICSFSQTTKRDLLNKYSVEIVSESLIPYSQWKPFPKTPAGWQKLLSDSLIRDFIRRGEANLNVSFEPIPATLILAYERKGDRAGYEAVSFRKRSQLWSLVMAETLEGKGRFADQILNGLWSICEETFWGSVAHIHYQKAGGHGLPDAEDPTVDLFAAETAVVLALTDYLVGGTLEKLSSLIRPRIYYEVNRRILVPMPSANYAWLGLDNPEKILNNWAPWVMSNYIAINLFLEKDEKKRAEAIIYAFGILDHYINGLGEDGSCEEGPSYWGAAAGSIYDALDLIKDATNGKVSIYDHPFIKKTGSYIYKMHIAGNYFVNNADADPKFTPDGLMLYRFGKAVNDPVMIQFGTWAFQHSGIRSGGSSHRTRTLFNYMALNEIINFPRVSYPDISHAWMPDVQVMTARSKNGFFLASHGGHNAEGHNHNDVGDFTVYCDGYPVIIDVGRGTYTYKVFHEDRYKLWFNNSAYHNLPVINGFTQPNGRNYMASDVKYILSNGQPRLLMDIAKAYPEDAGVQSWKRTVGMMKKGIIVSDAFHMNAELQSLSHSLMTVCDVLLDKPGVITFGLPDNKKVFMRYDTSKWDCQKEKIELITPEDQKFKSSWDGRDIWRILLTWKRNDSKGKYEFFFYL